MNVKAGDVKSFYESYYDRKVQESKQRYEQATTLSNVKKEDRSTDEEQAKAAVKELFGSEAAEVTLSEEGKRRYEALQQSVLYDIPVVLGKRGYYAPNCSCIPTEQVKDCAFTLEGMQRWNVFDEYLSYCGFYDNMEEDDIEKLRDTMSDILVRTSTWIDVKTKKYAETSSFSSGAGGRELYSYEAALEVESSTAALRLFSDQYLQEEQKSGFDFLIDKYYEDLSKHLQGYKSAEEALYESINDQGFSVSDETLRQYGLSEEQIKTHRISVKLGGVKHTKEEEGAYRNALRQLFSSINRENQASVFKRLEELVINYASGNSSDQDVRNVVRMRTQGVRDNVQNYWGKLFELNL